MIARLSLLALVAASGGFPAPTASPIEARAAILTRASENDATRTTGAPRAAGAPTVPRAAGATRESPDPVAAAKIFAETRAIVRRDAGKLWGRSLDAPILFVDPATRRAVASVADAEGRFARQGDVFAGSIPPDVPIANTAVEWSGVRWTMVLWPPPDDARARATLLAHELFHRLQPQLGFALADPANDHLDSAVGRYLLRLEWRALRAALAGRGRARRTAVADALAFRARRRELFRGAAKSERALEMNEGLAEYTGVRLARPDARERAAAAIELVDDAPSRPSFVRSFAYVSGPAYGLLLDARAESWRRGLRPESDLGDVLARWYEVHPDASAAAARAGRYRGAALLADELARTRAHERRLASYRRRLIEGPVLRVALEGVRLSFDPNALVSLAGAGTVYPRAEFSGAWGVLKVTDGALVAPDWSTLTVAAPPSDGAVEGPGWSLVPAPGWRAVRAPDGSYALERR